MIDAERINSQLSHGKFKRFNLSACGIKTACLQWHREDQQFCKKGDYIAVWGIELMQRDQQSTFTWKFKRFNLSFLMLVLKLLHYCLQLMQRGSTVNFHMENSKDLTYFSCMLVLKLFTLLFTIDTERINSLCMWKGDCLCMWKGDCLCTWKGNCLCDVKRWLPLDPGDWWLMQRGSTVNFHMENSKDLTYFSCMLVLKLFTLLFTIDTERINSLCMWKGDCFSACEKVITSACLYEKVIASVDPGGLMINAERINSQLSHEKFKRFNLFLLHVGIKTVYITVYNWHREDQQSTFTWKIQKI